jgi:hypothetical protein
MSKDASCGQDHDIQTWRGRDVCMDCEYTDSSVPKESVVKHDPKCLAPNPSRISPVLCTFCQIIRSVRQEYETETIEGVPI